MRTQIQKWGNSLAVRIPARFAKRLNLQVSSYVDIDIDLEEEQITMHKVHSDLDMLLDGITTENSHSILNDDTSRGSEKW